MLSFEVRRFPSRSGGEIAVLLDRSTGPAFWPNVFVTVEYRKRTASPNTCVKVLRTLGMARMWAASQGRDLDQDLRHGGFLTLGNVESLADYLSLSASAQQRRTVSAAPSAMPPNITRLEDLRPSDHSLPQSGQRGASPVEVAARLRWVASYVDWHLGQRLGSLDRRREDATALEGIGKSVVARLRQRAPRTASAGEDEEALEGVPREVLAEIEGALVPGGPGNPFRGGFIQARNYLIWRLLLDTGARRNEVREAVADDIEYASRRFHIRVSKTQSRRGPIGADTADAFDRFMERHWSFLPQAARRRGYLFTDEHGRHLSIRAFNRIFERVRKQVPGVPGFMAPHTVRRSWNDAFSARVDALAPEHRPSEKQEVEMRNRLQGWSGQSSMGARYAKRHIRRKADEIAEGLILDLVGPKRT